MVFGDTPSNRRWYHCSHFNNALIEPDQGQVSSPILFAVLAGRQEGIRSTMDDRICEPALTMPPCELPY